ncbi:tRNA(Ile)-lysidine synthetase, variant [Aphanomyces astaci]|uniref:tRNA(Ile)-lysidine synthetase n=1 Tax=Aphanomyces astaci TaxID=112090 RepID=W4GQ26_APHAT|nr:tRNA(Ile)-lysidine synthetase, variant [Aphanomyces astaci]ETV80978.1 tRNA(Ile)-lysidine synthetase, variant [Aphanomyces astaci]|eukprot:XP_009829925.1 tRNA(Ile)-lysidine synthetase, variant [Aphanomyces astaci]
MTGNEGGEATTAEEVLSYWFDGDMQELHRTKWFPVSGSDVQAATDADITSRFGTLLATAETRALHASWTSRPHSFVALIVLLDQFCRHVYRHDADKRKAIDVLALELATQFVDDGLHLHVSVPHFVFALMPFRHSPTPDRLEHVLAHIDGRETTMLHDTDLLSKFRRTTVQRQSHLRVPNHREPGEEFDILERAAFLHPNEALLLPKHPLVPIMHAFLTSMRAGSDACPAIGISLSGGVDSMVIAYLLVTLAPRYNNFKVVAVHIDYLNRPESSAEAAYVRAWAHDHNIECIVRPVEECQRATTKREDYEKLSRDIRYTTYQDVMARFTIPGMCVGHHRGDVQENVISNMMKGQSLLGLNGMTPSSMVNGVRIWRPLLAVNKDAIFDFAHTFGVPYFKDTTPQWSTRGKLRRQLMPLLQNIYGDGYLNNLSNLGQEATECADVLETALLGPVLNTVQSSGLAVWIDLTLLCAQPMFLWKEILRRVCHERMGERMIRDKPMGELRVKVLKPNFKASWITLKKQTKSFVTTQKHLVLFREPVFQTVFPPDLYFVAETTPLSTVGPWRIQLRLVASPHTDAQVLEVSYIYTSMD